MVRFAVGYRSRAFVTFGKPMQTDGIDANFFYADYLLEQALVRIDRLRAAGARKRVSALGGRLQPIQDHPQRGGPAGVLTARHVGRDVLTYPGASRTPE